MLLSKTYVLYDNPFGNGIHYSHIKLMDVYFKDNVIYLIVQVMLTGKVIKRSHSMNNVESKCRWVLVDLKHFQTTSKCQAIQSIL